MCACNYMNIWCHLAKMPKGMANWQPWLGTKNYNSCSLVVYLERKCKKQISRSKLKYQYIFTNDSSQGKLNFLNLVTSLLFSSVVCFKQKLKRTSTFKTQSPHNSYKPVLYFLNLNYTRCRKLEEFLWNELANK